VAKFLQKALDDMAETAKVWWRHCGGYDEASVSQQLHASSYAKLTVLRKASATPENKELAKKFVKIMQVQLQHLPSLSSTVEPFLGWHS
jgi:hypothetical protein